jgi:hypothetical protein
MAKYPVFQHLPITGNGVDYFKQTVGRFECYIAFDNKRMKGLNVAVSPNEIGSIEESYTLTVGSVAPSNKEEFETAYDNAINSFMPFLESKS